MGLPIQVLYDLTTVHYVYVAAYAILVYDYILTIHLEVQLVWFAPWNYTKILFFLTRYIPLAALYSHLQLHIVPGQTSHTCASSLRVVTSTVLIGLFTAETILLVRTWAVWRRNRIVGLVLAAALVTNVVVNCVVLVVWMKSLQLYDPPYPQYAGCVYGYSLDIVYISYITAILLHSIALFLMTLSAYRAFSVGSYQGLTTIVHRDGILFYVIMLIGLVSNIVLDLIARRGFRALPQEFVTCLFAVLTARIVLNIRGITPHNETSLTIQLHDSYEFGGTLEFHSMSHIPDASWQETLSD